MDFATTGSIRLRDREQRKTMSDIAAVDLGGKPWKLSAYKGKVVVLNFWASWCPPCRQETPDLVGLAREFESKGVQVVGISMDDGPEPVHLFVKQFHIPYPVLLPDAGSSLVAAVESLPTTFVIDRNGRVAAVHIGAITKSQLRGELERLLGET